MKDNEFIKRCPFCGGKPICIPVPSNDFNKTKSYNMVCNPCGVFMNGLTFERVLKRWNTRSNAEESRKNESHKK